MMKLPIRLMFFIVAVYPLIGFSETAKKELIPTLQNSTQSSSDRSIDDPCLKIDIVTDKEYGDPSYKEIKEAAGPGIEVTDPSTKYTWKVGKGYYYAQVGSNGKVYETSMINADTSKLQSLMDQSNLLPTLEQLNTAFGKPASKIKNTEYRYDCGNGMSIKVRFVKGKFNGYAPVATPK